MSDEGNTEKTKREREIARLSIEIRSEMLVYVEQAGNNIMVLKMKAVYSAA